MDDARGDGSRAPYDPMPHGPAEVGVGPWSGPWPTDPLYDVKLLAEGDRRNVVDRYRYWTVEAIVADLDTRRHDFHVAIENWQHDFNIGTIVRTANAFLAAEVHIVGRRRWNRRGAMVTDRYQHVRHHAAPADLATYLHGSGVRLLGIDNLPGSSHLETMTVPRRVCFLFGQEGPGLTREALDAADLAVEITQYGSTRSINASAAAAIVMHTWVRTQECIAIAAAAEALIERVEPNCAMENVPSHASRAPSERPGPSCPKRKQTRRGIVIVSRCREPGRLSMPRRAVSRWCRYAARSAALAWCRTCW